MAPGSTGCRTPRTIYEQAGRKSSRKCPNVSFSHTAPREHFRKMIGPQWMYEVSQEAEQPSWNFSALLKDTNPLQPHWLLSCRSRLKYQLPSIQQSSSLEIRQQPLHSRSRTGKAQNSLFCADHHHTLLHKTFCPNGPRLSYLEKCWSCF